MKQAFLQANRVKNNK